MVDIKTQIEKILGRAVTASNVDICDYQCNAAFAIAKERGAKPYDIAREIADKFNATDHTRRAASAHAHPSGFVNFVVTDTAITEFADMVLKTKKLPLAKQTPRTIYFDYGSPNIAKPLHVGHLRSPIIGEALKRVFSAFGHKCIAENYLGDWGLPMGLVIAQLYDDGLVKNDVLTTGVRAENLNEIYPKASARNKTDKKFADRAADITAKLQKKTEPFYGIWQKIREISVDNIQKSYAVLNCKFDIIGGESRATEHVPTVIEIMKKHGAHESDGCLIIDVSTPADTAPMPPVILQKQNGGDLYATSDIASIYDRIKKYKPAEIIYCVDFRQELHLEQVFRAVKIAGIAENTKFTHVSYGTMNGKDGKPFKTRSGDTVRLDDVFALVTEAAAKRMQKPNENTARTVGLAALKFGDLINSVRRDYVFDIEKFTAFEGKTGAYLLYTIARINAVLKKSGKDTGHGDQKSPTQLSPLVRAVYAATMKLTDAFTTAIENYTLNAVADAAWAVANKFNLLYAAETIAGNATNTKAAQVTRTALCFALDILAIDTVDEM